MTKQIQAELLVLGLLLLGSIRFIFVNHARRDSLSAVPFIALVFSIFNVIVFGFSIREAVIFIFALWTSVWNFRSVLRLVSEVVTDRYDLRLVIVSILNAIACIFFVVMEFCFLPASSDAKKMGVTEKIISCQGNFEKGFSEIQKPFEFTSARIWNFEGNAGNGSSRIIVVFVPPKTADVGIYRMLLEKLAKNGCSVYAADFRCGAKWFGSFLDLPFMQRFAFIASCIKDRKKYSEILTANKNDLVQEYEHLLKFASPGEGDLVFLIAEDDVAGAMKTVRILNGSKITGSFDLTYLEDNPSKGFGPVENTDPLLAWHLGLEPDRSGYISSHLATEVTDFISRLIVEGK